MAMKMNAIPNLDIGEVWKKASKRIRNMSEEESLSIFVNAGILTPKGNVRKPFREVIVPIKLVPR